jgi:lysylphosphatidylglycerol synthetase-like protein (DUF2156 family)
VQLRLGTTLALAGRPAYALTTLDAYLAKHPADHERLFLAMRVLYDVRSRGASVGTAAADRERFARYAAAYAAAGGPDAATVEQWKRVIVR